MEKVAVNIVIIHDIYAHFDVIIDMSFDSQFATILMYIRRVSLLQLCHVIDTTVLHIYIQMLQILLYVYKHRLVNVKI
jgi:hypothetical protein